jgi:hypothetical protein
LAPAEESIEVGVGGIVGEMTGSGAFGVGVSLGTRVAVMVSVTVAGAPVGSASGGSGRRVATSVGAGTSALAQARAATNRLPTNNGMTWERIVRHVPLPGSAPDLVFIIPT